MKRIATTTGKVISVFIGAPFVFAVATYISILLGQVFLRAFSGDIILPDWAIIGVWLVLSLVPTLLFIHLLWRYFGERWYITVSGLLGVVILVGGAILLSSLNSGPHRPNRDTRRIVDIKQMQLALELYSDGDGKGGYPPLSETCQDASILQNHLFPKYIPIIPRDRLADSGHPNYQIAVSSDRQQYVLQAVLEDKKSSVLQFLDIDGQVLGCECDDPIYCATP
ncbi:MAG: hypothetical protein G01um101433_73 [Parcubacteria group bacterium Gr01-1014_33]|nr:MAG: hypothetical protein G01um101433_73 [Parcubacteria group bacterium Gr01-1014_33]